MENEVQTKEKSLAFWLILLAALFAGVVGIFAMMEKVLPQQWEAKNEQQAAEIVEEEQLPAPKFCPYCGDDLPESFEWGRFCPYCGKIIDN